MSANFSAIAYLIAAVCFILALKGLSSPTSARRGNLFGIAGMAIAVATTLAQLRQRLRDVLRKIQVTLGHHRHRLRRSPAP